MLFLPDASVLITAHRKYYPIDRVEEFWSWLQYQGTRGRVKIPREIFEEILEGHENDLLRTWITERDNRAALLLDETVDGALVSHTVSAGYANDLTDVEVEVLGRDPFLVAYGRAVEDRCVVTTEVSAPGKQRQNRRIPDVCRSFAVLCCDPFELNSRLDFRTGWRRQG